MTTISAKTILRSRNASAPDKVLSTLLLRYPRFIHAEFMTHRVFSRNAASSRAIPVKKMIDDILADTAMPIHWGAAQKGMQADQECDAPLPLIVPGGVSRERAWLWARDEAIRIATAFDNAGYHKQVINRLLEPFLHITVLVSSTEWDNFLELRDHRDAEPHIQMLALEIRKCLEDESTVQTLKPGQWHMPFITTFDEDLLYEASGGDHNIGVETLRKVSVARCASTSYKTTDGFDMSLGRATAIYDKLFSKPFHASPFEHVAQADEYEDLAYHFERPAFKAAACWKHSEEHGNFVGFRQFRRQLELQA
ncbi:Thymidylate synthase complementing protein [Agrobacterium fabrum]|uniref:Thymidylate synthase complementing protein n=1 Tax=Agrobacterium fabrum TaxID=1176649 RepID=A0A7Z7BHI2_9HYPH|nr:FAD-dependent thymidylate synthase [Agrobacterium fabrum]SDJ25543.1 Thymidylate synthase complementing protein [Agrobacterium fabrum]